MRSAVFPGTFDPIHSGHVDVIERGLRLFDRVVVAVAAGHHKSSLFSPAERIEIVEEVVGHHKGVEVKAFDGLLVDLSAEVNSPVVLRGIRNLTDYEFETQMAFMNRMMRPELELIFLPADKNYAHINSTLVREIARLGGDISGFVPPAIAEAVRKKLGRNQG